MVLKSQPKFKNTTKELVDKLELILKTSPSEEESNSLFLEFISNKNRDFEATLKINQITINTNSNINQTLRSLQESLKTSPLSKLQLELLEGNGHDFLFFCSLNKTNFDKYIKFYSFLQETAIENGYKIDFGAKRDTIIQFLEKVFQTNLEHEIQKIIEYIQSNNLTYIDIINGKLTNYHPQLSYNGLEKLLLGNKLKNQLSKKIKILENLGFTNIKDLILRDSIHQYFDYLKANKITITKLKETPLPILYKLKIGPHKIKEICFLLGITKTITFEPSKRQIVTMLEVLENHNSKQISKS